MIIRQLKQSELEYSIRMSEYAFQYQLSDEERKERLESMEPDHTWVIEDDGDIVSKATILPLSVYLDGKQLTMGGISGVVTWPEHRRSGLVAKLLKHSLEEMKENGQILSFLYPFSIPFYRKYGWELFADMTELTLTKEQLPKREVCNGKVKRIEKDSSLIDHIYQQWAKAYTGTIVRDEKWWTQSVFKRKKGTVAAYYNENNTATGYLIYDVKEQKMTVHELIWLDTDARKGLLTFISNHDSMIDTVTIKTSANGPLPFILHDPKVKRNVISYFMTRITDVKAFLTAYPFTFSDGDMPLILHVDDAVCSWNDGIFIVKPDHQNNTHSVDDFPTAENRNERKKNAACQHPPKKGVRLSINTLSALMMGAQSVKLLWKEGQIAGDNESISILERVIPELDPFFYDFF